MSNCCQVVTFVTILLVSHVCVLPLLCEIKNNQMCFTWGTSKANHFKICQIGHPIVFVWGWNICVLCTRLSSLLFSHFLLFLSSFTWVRIRDGASQSERFWWNQLSANHQFHVEAHQVLFSAVKSGCTEASILLSNSSSMVTTIATIPSEVGISEDVSWLASSEKIFMKNLFLLS